MKIIRVDMSKKSICVEDVPKDYFGLGGRALTAAIMNKEVPPMCDSLGPENKLIFAPGLLSGTNFVNTSRISVGTKSPLTGTIKESNGGGTIAAALGHLGITAVVVEGKSVPGEMFILGIDEKGEASLIKADEYKGMRTYKMMEKLVDIFGNKISVMCIGPAGEYMMKSASIQTSDVDNHPCRAAARGGVGAVMGAKGLKALVVDRRGKSADVIADPEAFKEAAKTFALKLKENPFTGQLLGNFGTAGILGAVNAMGAFPSYNATKGVLDGWENISGETLSKVMKERGGGPGHMGCAQCAIHCSNIFNDSKGNYVTSSLEYETIWALGGMTGIKDLDTIARLDFLCDDIGLDTMNTGVAIAVAMDAGYKNFGDGQAAIEMIEEIAKGSEMGKILGDGPEAVGRHFKHHRIPAVKGQSVAAYDPRAMQGLGVTYATSTMGADHTAGNVFGLYMAKKLDPLKPEGQVAASRGSQIAMAAMDSIGMCILAAVALASPEAGAALVQAISAKIGKQMEGNAIAELGMRTIKMEKEFNQKAGITSRDDRLPGFYYKEALPPHNTVFEVKDEELDTTLDF